MRTSPTSFGPRKAPLDVAFLWALRSAQLLAAVFGAFAVAGLGAPAGAVPIRGGDIILADTAGASIIKVDPRTGSQAPVAQGGLLRAPVEAAVRSDGTLLVADRGDRDPATGGGSLIGINPATGAQERLLDLPAHLPPVADLVLDGHGTPIVGMSDFGGNTAIASAHPASGSFRLLFAVHDLGVAPNLVDMAVAADGSVLYTENFSGFIVSSESGFFHTSIGSGSPTGIDIAPDGSVLVVEPHRLGPDGFIFGSLSRRDPETLEVIDYVCDGAAPGTLPPAESCFLPSGAQGELALAPDGTLVVAGSIASARESEVVSLDPMTGEFTLRVPLDFTPSGVSVAPIPEPSALLLFSLGALVVGRRIGRS